jgi:hypothetical protein
MADTAALTDASEELKQAATEAGKQDNKVESKYNEYTRGIKEKRAAKEKYEQSMDEAKEQVKANDAEYAAGELFSQQQGGQVIDLASALKLVDQEREAKSMLRELEASSLKAETEYMGYTIKSGMEMAFTDMDNAIDYAISGGAKGTGGAMLKTSLALVAGSFVAGSALQRVGEGYVEATAEGMSTGDALKVAAWNAIGLNAVNEVDEDVEDKLIDGETYEYLGDDENDDTTQTEDKPLPEEEIVKNTDNKDDIIGVNKEQFEIMMQETIGKIMSPEQVSALTGATTLMSNIAEGVSPGAGENVLKLVGNMSSAYAKLQEQKAAMDNNQNGDKETENSGPSY